MQFNTYIMKVLLKSTQLAILDGLSKGENQKAIAQKTGVAQSTISKYKAFFGVKRKNRAGRKRMISESNARLMGRGVYKGELATAAIIEVNSINKNIGASAKTIRRVLKNTDFNASYKIPGLLLTEKRKMASYEWAKKYESWTVENWRQVIFSDETKIYRLDSDGKQWVWIKKGKPLRQHNFNFKYKGDGGHLMIWSCITARGPGYMVKIDNGLDAQLYCDILNSDLIMTLNEYGWDLKDIIFQHDNDPKHTAATTKSLTSKSNMKVLDWPPFSPDMNPIEHMWSFLKKRLNQYDWDPKNLKEAFVRGADIWYKEVTPEMCCKYIDSMPKRIEALIEAKGGMTKY